MSYLKKGRVIAARYEVSSLLGHGGMSEVHIAVDRKLKRRVALKCVRMAPHDKEECQRRLMREARALASLAHPNIVRVFDVAEENDDVFVIMELVSGKSLRERISELALDEKLRVVGELGEALQAVHDLDLLHRDVKPENIMIRPNGSAVLLDFGFVKSLSKEVIASMNLSEEAVFGTAGYLSPEQANGEELDARSDQFSLAIVAYELLAGKRPWEGDNNLARIKALATSEAPAITSVKSSLPPELDDVFAKGLSKERKARFGSAAALALAIRACFGAVPAVSRPSAAVFRRRRVTVGAALAAALSAGAYGVQQCSTAKHDTPLPPPPPLRTPLEARDSVLGCPILESRGVPEPSGWLGAAAAELVCNRLLCILGCRDERTLLPAELLDLPRRPLDAFPDDPYVAPTARIDSVNAAKTKSAAFVDGGVTRDAAGFKVELVLRRSPSGEEIARASGNGAELQRAVMIAADALVAPDRVPKAPATDPSYATWWGVSDVDAAQYLNTFFMDDAGECEAALKYRDGLGLLWRLVERRFELQGTHCGPAHEKAALLTDTRAHLVTSARGYTIEYPAKVAEVAAQLDEAARIESDLYGRSLLATTAAQAWLRVSEPHKALASGLMSVEASPREAYWGALALASRDDRYARASAAWSPSDMSIAYQTRFSPALRERYAQRGFLLANDQPALAVELGSLLSIAGKKDEVLALANGVQPTSEPRKEANTSLLAMAAKSEGQFLKAFDSIHTIVMAKAGGLNDQSIELIAIADVIGKGRAFADEWIAKFLLPKDAKNRGPQFDLMAVAMCIRASAGPAKQCIDEVRRRRANPEAQANPTLDAFIVGAEHFGLGRLDDAAKAWRPLVLNNLVYYALLLPAELFDQSGDVEVAEVIDADELSSKAWHGIGAAYPRAAKRALARGDKAKAREYAQAVVDAWGPADVRVPAVEEMKKLVKQLR